jgi:hypothetical protein
MNEGGIKVQDSPVEETFRDTERKLRQKIARLEMENQPLDKYNSELTTIENKSYISGFILGFIACACLAVLLSRVF